MDGREYAVDVVERVRFDERFDLDLAFEHQLERRRVGFRRAAPVADGARVVLKWFADESVADRYAVLFLPLTLAIAVSRGGDSATETTR